MHDECLPGEGVVTHTCAELDEAIALLRQNKNGFLRIANKAEEHHGSTLAHETLVIAREAYHAVAEIDAYLEGRGKPDTGLRDAAQWVADRLRTAADVGKQWDGRCDLPAEEVAFWEGRLRSGLGEME